MNGFYLSGLLIGAEIRDAPVMKTVLAAGSQLSPFYMVALHQLRGENDLIAITASEVDAAIIKGHLTIFKKISGTDD